MPDLRDHTTLRLGGPAREWVTATTEADLVAAVADADAAGTPVLLVAGGSNLVVADAGFDGRVVKVATSGVEADTSACEVDTLAQCGGVGLTVAAGQDWDALVARAVANGWAGIEALSPKQGTSLGTEGDGWSHPVYTVTPGVPGDSGSAFLDAEGNALGTLSTLAIAPLAGSNGVSDLAHELGYAQQHGGIAGLRLVPGTEPFSPIL